MPYAQRAAQQGLERSAYAEAVTHASSVVEWAGALPAAEGVEAELDANGVLTQAMMPFRGWADPQVKATVDRSAVLLRQLKIGTAATGCRTCGACSPIIMWPATAERRAR